MRKLKIMGLALLCIFIAPVLLLAGGFDGSQSLLCATIEAVECGSGGECLQGTAESVDIPQFFKIDFKKKLISATKESGDKRTSKIKTMERMKGRVILQGMEEDLAWTLAMSEETGKVVITAAGDQVGFIVFGACTPL